ncbi:V-type proton ATPase subunit H isoform X3 [Plutella xylostella]|uniref:V-type proton ATPase subunit H isoform X1 n=1 Tax=Plutella xylostella TaxID=51655 RepID=UPI0018D1EA16|nr:V-type proton ATPase subunit H isoform X1 [Plutella xylostella]XP_048478824.1 V-type proton ATPase subunit H isoform X2 [Plutella xylostella]XP_048478830.1 V-type proton ATPase subunit H isoform X3 [Plutella xylostella]
MANIHDENVSKLIPKLDDDKIDMIAATSVLQIRASEIRQTPMNWQSYLQSQMITQHDHDFIQALVNKGQKDLPDRQPEVCAAVFLNLLTHISKDNTIQYILVLIDDILSEDKSRVKIFRDKGGNWKPFLNLLNRQDEFIQHMTARIIAKLACWHPVLMERSDLNFYLSWLMDQLKMNAEVMTVELAHAQEVMLAHEKPNAERHRRQLFDDKHNHKKQPEDPNQKYSSLCTEFDELKLHEQLPPGSNKTNDYIQSVARCLQMMLRVDEYRFAFLSVDGISTLLSILASRVNFQVQYQLVFCLWVLTFNPLLAEKMNKFNAIPILADILSDSVKEKVTRIVLAVLRNLIEKPEDKQVSKEHCIAMVQCKVLKQLSILEQKRSDDEDIMNDVDFLNERLQASVQDLSSFDQYATEIKSGRLEWSPVHKSAKFWRENAARLNERGQELLRTLVHLLERSADPVVLAVACYDVGEYVRHYPRGKHIIEQLGGKQRVMYLLSHDDPNVRYEALLAVQKLMVHNWEYLGKQLEKDVGKQEGGQAIGAKA